MYVVVVVVVAGGGGELSALPSLFAILSLVFNDRPKPSLVSTSSSALLSALDVVEIKSLSLLTSTSRVVGA